MTARYVILLGAPGAGKGTQAARISEVTGLVHVATGDIFRENVRGGTELGLLAKGYMDRGQLVPDDVTIRMLLERISRPDCSAGVMLDGFPRTIAQAEALDAALAGRGAHVETALYVEVPDEALMKRLTSRWLCRTCDRIYNAITNPPPTDGSCEPYQRDDDKPEAVARRLRVFHEETEPLMTALGLPYPTIVGKVAGGAWASSVMDRVVGEGRYGVRLGQTPGSAADELRACIRAACADDSFLAANPATVEVTGARFGSARVAADHPLPAGLIATAKAVTGRRPQAIGVPYGADMRLFIDVGDTPCVIFGPGDVRLAHGANESVPLAEVEACARVLAAWVADQLGA